jgi:O-antigen/teichoic acid export membrane protein
MKGKTLYLLGGNVAWSLSGYVMILIIARAVSKNDFGQFMVVMSAVAVLSALVNLQMRDLIYSRLDFEENKRRYLGLRVASGVVVLIVSLLGAVVWGEANALSLVFGVAFLKVLEGIQEVSLAGSISLGRYRYMFVVQSVAALLKVGSALVGLALGWGLIGILAVVGVVSLIVPAFTSIQDGGFDLKGIWKKDWVDGVVRSGFALGIGGVIDAAAGASPRFILLNQFGEAAVADMFVLMLIYQGVGLTAGLVLSQVVTKQVSILGSKGDFKGIQSVALSTSIKVIVGTAILTLVCAAFGSPILEGLFGAKYQGVGVNLWIAALASGVWLLAGTASCVAIGLKYYKIVPWANLAMLVVVMAAVWGLALVWGVAGAIVGVMLGSVARGAVIVWGLMRRNIWSSPEGEAEPSPEGGAV